MIKPTAAWLLLTSGLVLNGCSLIPSYERPAPPVPTHYNYDTGKVASSSAPLSLDWRNYFSDPNLQALIGIALENNRDLRVAALNLERTRAQYQVQRAALFPSVGLQANAARGNSQVTGELGNTFSVGLVSAGWEIDFFGRVNSLKEQALANYLATEEARKSYELALISSVAQMWLSLAADEELLDISQRTLATREATVKLAKLRFDSGVASELDFQQAQSLTEAARATYAQQQRQRALDEHTLSLLLGQEVPADVLHSIQGRKLSSIAPLANIPVGLSSELLERRPDIRQAEHQLLAANANIGAARAAFFPSISLTAQYGSVSSELDGLFRGGSWGFNIGPTLNLPIFNAGRNRANLEVAQASRDIAVAQYEKAIQTAFKEVSDALASRTTLHDQAQAQQAQAEAERKRLHLSELRYQNGISSHLDLLDAQRSLFALEQAKVQVHLAQYINQINLYKALGGGWDSLQTGTTNATPPAVH